MLLCVSACKTHTMTNDDKETYQQNIPLPTTESHWKRIFDKYDKHGKGEIPLSELSSAIGNSNPDHFPLQVVSRILKKYDSNHNDCLSFPEFLDLVKNEEGRRLFRGWVNTYIRLAIPPRSKYDAVSVTDGDENVYAYSCFPPPVGMLIISLIEILFFVYDSSTYHQTNVLGPLATVCIYNPKRRKEAWRFLSYMFIHIGPSHLIMNLTFQVFLGIPLEMVQGWHRILIIYLSGVIAGSLGSSVCVPYAPLAGASGGVNAIIAAHVATIILNWSEMKYALAQLVVFLVIFGYDVCDFIYQRLLSNFDNQLMKFQKSYAAHFAGAIAGLLVGLIILRNIKVYPWENTLYRIAISLYFILTAAAILWNIFEPDYYPNQEV